MSFDFTLETYKELLRSLQQHTDHIIPFNELIFSKEEQTICLRHDVDLMPQNSLEFAKIQHDLNIRGTYYFRAKTESWDISIIKEIYNLGHEVGYHYENLSSTGGDLSFAIADFKKNLKKLEKILPVSTICMHGSPRSKFDSKELWKYFDYQDYGILGEPYFDVDFSEVLYLTDTGRRWNGDKFSLRDKLSKMHINQGSELSNNGFPNSGRFPEWKVKPKLNSSLNMSQEAIDFQNQYIRW